MFGSIGGPELILIFMVALLIFGPRKLPELGRMLGKGMGEFRRAANDLRVSLETEVAREGPERIAERGSVTAQLPAAAGAVPRSEVAPPSGTETAAPTGQPAGATSGVNRADLDDLKDPTTAPAAADTPTPAAAPDARDTDRTR